MFGIKQVIRSPRDSVAHFMDQSAVGHRIKGVITFGERLTAALIGLVLLAMLVVGAALRPAPEGHGTHQQMGLPPCGFYLATGTPCPTCGMTTAFTQAAHGRLDLALVAQPAGTVLAVLAAALFWVGLHTALTGSRVAPMLVGGLRGRHVAWLIGVILAGWGVTVMTFRPE